MKSVLITAMFNIGIGGAIPIVAPKGTGGGSGVTGVGAVSKLGFNKDVANIFTTAISYFKVFKNISTGGAGREVWYRVYMIVPVKKFGRVRLSTIFLQNKYGGECRHGGTMSFCSVLSFPASKHHEKVFENIFNGIFGHQEACCMNSSWVTTLSVIRHLGKFSYL